MAGIAPHVSLRTLRLSKRIELELLHERICELGERSWDIDHLRNVELGHKKPSEALMAAWAMALGIEREEIRTDRQFRDLLAAKDLAAKAVA
ncbi:hypothetical protein [Nocardiopsis synnemataformans]|uniref:hypothetical protein n=1 Tax=Nocardiopsis synnemataformans TaxID=61305 RepID=UPI003EBE0EA3